MITEILLLSGLVLIIYFKGRNKLPSNIPPGPFRVPGIGNLLQLGAYRNKAPFEALHELQKNYGPVMFLQMGVTYQVVVEDYSTIKEVLTNDLWIERHYSEWMARRSFGKNLGVLMISGDVWKEMRKFSIRTLRDFGFGKQKSMEIGLQDELSELVQNLEKRFINGKALIPMKQFFTVYVLNVLWNMIAGVRFCHDDAKIHELLVAIDNEARTNVIGTLSSPMYLYTIFPFLAKILPMFLSRDKNVIKGIDVLHNFFREILNERRLAGLYLQEQRDYIDVFLREIDAHKYKNPEINYYTDEQFIVVTMDLFMAGSETTSNTLEFGILYLMKHPEVQRRLQAEIDAIVGHNRFPCIADKQRMPYTEATLLEIQRHANVLPFSVRSPVRETTLRGYTIPEKTAGVINLHAMHMNDTEWGDPLNFRPERFLSSNMEVINAEKILPFGTGKRGCLGEQLAKATIFTFITTMLQKFSFEAHPEFLLPSSKPLLEFTLAPQPYRALIKPRNANNR